MNVAITLVVVILIAVWGLAVYGQLVRVRAQVKNAWTGRDRDSYVRRATAYNTALAAFPGNVVAGIAGFKPAKPFE